MLSSTAWQGGQVGSAGRQANGFGRGGREREHGGTIRTPTVRLWSGSVAVQAQGQRSIADPLLRWSQVEGLFALLEMWTAGPGWAGAWHHCLLRAVPPRPAPGRLGEELDGEVRRAIRATLMETSRTSTPLHSTRACLLACLCKT